MRFCWSEAEGREFAKTNDLVLDEFATADDELRAPNRASMRELHENRELARIIDVLAKQQRARGRLGDLSQRLSRHL